MESACGRATVRLSVYLESGTGLLASFRRRTLEWFGRLGSACIRVGLESGGRSAVDDLSRRPHLYKPQPWPLRADELGAATQQKMSPPGKKEGTRQQSA